MERLRLPLAVLPGGLGGIASGQRVSKRQQASRLAVLILMAALGVFDNTLTTPLLAIDTGCPGDGTNSTVVAEYVFNEGSGATAVNTGTDGSAGDATLTNGVSFSADVPPVNTNCGFSVSLPATGSGSSTPALETAANYDPLAGATNFTIMAWVKRESVGTASNQSARIVSDTSSTSLPAPPAGFEFRFSGSAGTLALRVNGNELSTSVGGIAPNDGNWHYVAVVYDGSRPATNALTRHAHFYVDGVQRGLGVSNSTLHVAVSTNSNRLTVGNSAVSRGLNNLLVGKIDDVRILRNYSPDAVGNGNTNATLLCYVNSRDGCELPPTNSTFDVVITELATALPDASQWVEIYNRGTGAVDVANWFIRVGGNDYLLGVYQGSTVLSGSTYAVVAREATSFFNANPTFRGTLLTSGFPALSPTGGQIELANISTNVIESFSYITNLTGTLERRNYDWADYSPTNWETSAEANGTPNRQNTRKSVRVYFNYPPRHNGSSEVDLETAFVNLINSATGTAWCAFYQLNRQKVVDSLCDAKTNRNVDVRFVTDTDYFSDPSYTNFYAQLQNSGITVMGDDRSSLMHNKFAVVDGRYIWTGSWNATDSGTTDDVQNGLILDSISVAQAYQREFNQFWSGTFGTAKTQGGTNEHTVAGATVKVFFSPKDGCTSNVVNATKSAISNNFFEIFTFTTNAISSAIITNRDNGLKVQGYMDNFSAGSPFSQYANLTNANVDVTRDTYAGLLHHKVMIVDAGVSNNSQLVTGSYNWTAAGNNENDENLLIVSSYDIANIFYQEFLTNRSWVDTDGDNMPDDWESANGLNPSSASDASQDSDGDGLTNLEEFKHNTNPNSSDTDGDGYGDGLEVYVGTDPLSANGHPNSLSHSNLFFYDNLGRFAVVIDTNSTDAAFYDYDAVGNITAIRRETVGPVNLFVFSPETGSGNATITLQGTGFSTNLADNTVLFGSITGQVVNATANQLKVLIPTNAVSSLISVTTPLGVSTNSKTFLVGIGVQVSPSSLTISGTFAQQFTATVYGTNDQNVTWNINGWIPAGSNTAWGMVSSSGLYTSPTNPPPAGIVTVRARSVADPDPLKEGVATITVLSPRGPIYSPTVSAQPGVPTVLGPIYSPTVSAQPGVPTVLGPIYSPTVSTGPSP